MIGARDLKDVSALGLEALVKEKVWFAPGSTEAERQRDTILLVMIDEEIAARLEQAKEAVRPLLEPHLNVRSLLNAKQAADAVLEESVEPRRIRPFA